MNNLLSVTYAASVAFSQAIATFAQVRADQQEIARMTDNQIQQLTGNDSRKTPIGFNKANSK